MNKIIPSNVVEYIKNGIATGVFKNQAEIVAIAKSSKSYVSQLMNGKVTPGWDFVQRFEQGLVENGLSKDNLSTKQDKNSKETFPQSIRTNGILLDFDENDLMMVPLVPKLAYAGYTRGFGDAEYIENLPKIAFPRDRERKGKYMAFEVSGDSMSIDARKTYDPGDIVLGREVSRGHWRDKLHIAKYSFIIVHKTDGILIKDILHHDVAKGVITLHSLNPEYEDFTVPLDDIAEIFNVVRVIKEP